MAVIVKMVVEFSNTKVKIRILDKDLPNIGTYLQLLHTTSVIAVVEFYIVMGKVQQIRASK